VVHRQRDLESVDGTRARRVGYRGREDDRRQASVAGGFAISNRTDDRKPSFESSIGFLLSQLGVRATRSWAAMLTELGLTPSAHAVLLTLRERGSLPLTELAAAIGTDPRNMGPVLDAIHPLIQRGTSPNDRRQRTVALSAPGRRIADQLADAAAGIEADFLSALDDEETETLRHLLLKLHARHQKR
jgi:DNA-binding MarR family transcriptional regulator